jgi:hypothetical protein
MIFKFTVLISDINYIAKRRFIMLIDSIYNFLKNNNEVRDKDFKDNKSFSHNPPKEIKGKFD